MSYSRATRQAFALEYARVGNATHALRNVLGTEHADRMQPHTLRARASELLNDCRTVELIEEAKAEMQRKGEPLPHYRGRTWRADLFSDEKDPPTKPYLLSSENRERTGTETVRAGTITASFATHQALINKLMNRLHCKARRQTKI